MILKKDNVERIVQSESVAEAMLSNGWIDTKPKVAEPLEDRTKRTRKKLEDTE